MKENDEHRKEENQVKENNEHRKEEGDEWQKSTLLKNEISKVSSDEQEKEPTRLVVGISSYQMKHEGSRP